MLKINHCRKLSVSALLICSITIGCLDNPKRTNPLDPKANNFVNNNTVSGEVITYYVPRQPIPEVEVRMEPGPFIARTDAQGQFKFEGVAPDEYAISVIKEGFGTELLDSVTVPTGKDVQLPSIRMDRLPTVESFSILSAHISRWFPRDDQFRMEITARLNDLDGINDIELVELEIAALDFVDTLTVMQTDVFSKRILQTELPGQNLQNVIGEQAVLKVRDRAGYAILSQPSFLPRIIEQTPVTKSPQLLDELDESRPRLIWARTNLPFDFTYRIEVIRDDSGISNIVWTQPNISMADTAITVTDSLATGTYYWTLSVIDRFGNWSRSKEASFKIN